MKILTIDWETYYDREYSLSKMTTEEYIRDDRFEVIGVAVKEDDNETVWYDNKHMTASRFAKLYDWKNCLVLAHNTQFDGAILSWRYGIKPKGWLDTLMYGSGGSWR